METIQSIVAFPLSSIVIILYEQLQYLTRNYCTCPNHQTHTKPRWSNKGRLPLNSVALRAKHMFFINNNFPVVFQRLLRLLTYVRQSLVVVQSFKEVRLKL
jgi:hypothetical protein